MIVTATYLPAGSARSAGDSQAPSGQDDSFRKHMHRKDDEGRMAHTRQHSDPKTPEGDRNDSKRDETDAPEAEAITMPAEPSGDTVAAADMHDSEFSQNSDASRPDGPFPTLTTRRIEADATGRPDRAKTSVHEGPVAQMIRNQIMPSDAGSIPEPGLSATGTDSEVKPGQTLPKHDIAQGSVAGTPPSIVAQSAAQQPRPALVAPLHHLMAKSAGTPLSRHEILHQAQPGMPMTDAMRDGPAATRTEDGGAPRSAIWAGQVTTLTAAQERPVIVAGTMSGLSAPGAQLPGLPPEPAEPMLRLSDAHPGALASQPLTQAEFNQTAALRPLPPGLADHRAAAIRAQLVSEMRQGGPSSVTLQLAPAELGKVQIRVMMGDTGMQVTFQVERPETLDLMRRFAQDLEQDLRDSGFPDTQMEFSHRETPDHPDRPKGRTAGVPEPDPTLPSRAAIGPNGTGDFGAMDIRV